MFYRRQIYYFGIILIILHTKIKGKFVSQAFKAFEKKTQKIKILILKILMSFCGFVVMAAAVLHLIDVIKLFSSSHFVIDLVSMVHLELLK